MKRYLKNDRYQLSLREQEGIWKKVRFPIEGENTEAGRAPRRAFRPVFGLTTVTAALVIAALWWTNADKMGFRETSAPRDLPGLDSGPVAMQPVEATESEASIHARVREDKPDGSDTEAGAGVVAKAKESYDLKLSEENKAPLTLAARRDDMPQVSSRAGDKLTVVADADLSRGPTKGTPGDGAPPPAVPRQLAVSSVTAESEGGAGSITGGTKPPNGEAYESMYFDHAGVNPFFTTEEDALSTFAVDVDNASYTVARNYLDRGVMPPADAIRVEEFVNFFSGGYPEQSEQDFVIHTDGAPSRYGEGYHLLRIGLQGMNVAAADRKSANLIFVIDVSGSMSSENRLGLVKQSLHVLLDELREGDSVGIVVYGSRGEVKLTPMDVSSRETITAAIDGLQTNGSTNVYEGLDLAYQLAREHYSDQKLNRLILCSDGVANTGGSTEAEEILARIRRESDEGITLSAVGFGMGNYNDVLMEKLADKGDGNYYYVDELKEAERVFRENLTGTLQTIAREVKVQVEFDPEAVDRWRLLGYENRDVADRDFRNDSIDAGEVGSGHQVTALYELKLIDRRDHLGTVRLRWEAPRHDAQRAGQVTELAAEITRSQLAEDFATADRHLRLQAVVAEFAEILRGSVWARESTLAELVPVAAGLAEAMPGDARVQEFAKLVAQATAVAAEDEMRRKGQD